jgi:hypothetical protein
MFQVVITRSAFVSGPTLLEPDEVPVEEHEANAGTRAIPPIAVAAYRSAVRREVILSSLGANGDGIANSFVHR